MTMSIEIVAVALKRAPRAASVAAMMIAATGCQHRPDGAIESISAAPVATDECPDGQYLARVCAPEPNGPCGLRCVAPIEGGAP
jgi:hypothetical protein